MNPFNFKAFAVKNGKSYTGKTKIEVVDQLASFTATIEHQDTTSEYFNPTFDSSSYIRIKCTVLGHKSEIFSYSIEDYSIEEAIKDLKIRLWSNLSQYGYETN